jgi:hypothetical protein
VALARGFAAAAGGEHGEGELSPAPAAEGVRDGIKLIGADGGLSCITCHDFKDRVALGTRGPDMTEMYARMRPEWFLRWLRDPIRIQPGTAMPSFFGSMPEGEAAAKMGLIWTALSAGKGMPMPAGFADPQSFLLAVRDEPLTVRTFMPDSSPRSIAVGLPGKQAYCFDAEECRLRYAWAGDFLDMSPVWGGRGGQPAVLLGERYYAAPDLFPLRIGEPEKVPVRRFRGYAMVEKLPEFRYELDGVPVRQRIAAAPEGLGLSLSFELGPTSGDVWYLAADAPGVSTSSAAGQWEGKRLRVPGGPQVRFAVLVRAEEK